METLFISDLHLCPERPEKLALFKTFMRGPARGADALYILGDLFENFWAGNDDTTPPTQEVITELKDFSKTGTKLFFIRGNRELVLDKDFELLTGCTLLEDGTVIEMAGNKVLLMHGDRLCTRDIAYQWYRRFMETSLVKATYLALPYRVRTLLAHGLRPLMRRSTSRKSPEIIDVDQGTVEKTMRDAHVQTLIHGHTHRPGKHEFDLGGKPATRIVLGDWYEKDSVLVCSNGEKKLVRITEYSG